MPVNIKIPGSKSIANRALFLAALNGGEIILQNAPDCEDTSFMISALKSLGIEIEQKGNTIRINGNAGNFENSKSEPQNIQINTGNAGTVTRFMTAFGTLTGHEILIECDARMKERPIEELIKALNMLGAKVGSAEGYPPVIIYPQKIKGGAVTLAGNISSQYLSALLMTCPLAPQDTTINIEHKLYSRPYIEMTIKLLNEFGIVIKNNNFEQFVIPGNQKISYQKLIYEIESDASSASYFGAYAALHPNKKIVLENMSKNSLQGDIKFIDYLEKMGCQIKENSENLQIKGPTTLKSLGEINMNETPDLVMTFAVLAMFTKEKTKIIDIKNLRIKETDRLKALENEIKKFNISVKTGEDYIEINGDPAKMSKIKQKIAIETYNDHRIAMAFGILKDIIPHLVIKNPSCVKKSYTTFWEDLKKIQTSA